MSFGASPSDVANAIKLILSIYETWFVKENRGDNQYRRFKQSITGFKEALEALNNAYAAGNRFWSESPGQYLSPLNPALEKDRKALVGDFEATLEECKKLLTDTVGASKATISFAANAWYHISTSRAVDALIDRIMFHVNKITLITKPLELGLLRNIAENVAIMRKQLMEVHSVVVGGTPANEMQPPPIPEIILTRLTQAFNSDQPEDFSNGHGRRVESIFAVLHSTFLESTYSYQSFTSGVQTMEQYFNLIKAQFLLEQLRNESGLSGRYYYEHTTLLIELEIRTQFRRTDIRKYTIEQLKELDDRAFRIWVPQEQLRALEIGSHIDDGVPTINVLEVSLVPDPGMMRQELVVLRQTKTEFRVVRKIDPIDPTQRLKEEPYPMNLKHHSFIPLYAVSTNTTVSTKVQICPNTLPGSNFYTFKDQRDARHFQHSLIGYRVVYDSFIETPPNPGTEASRAWNGNNCTWQFHRKEKGYNSIASQNRVQLWQGEERGPHKKPRESLTSGSDEASVTSQAPSDSTAATSMHSLPAAESIDLLFNKKAGSITSGQTLTGKDMVTVIRQPKKPVLFIFTMVDGKFSFIHVELSPKHYFPNQPCMCKKPANECRHVLIKNEDSELLFRKYSVAPSQIHTWDLSLFALPRHDKFDKLKIEKTKYLSITFSSPRGRDDFVRDFEKLMDKHKKELITVERERERKKRLADRPKEPSSPPSPRHAGVMSPRAGSFMSSGSTRQGY